MTKKSTSFVKFAKLLKFLENPRTVEDIVWHMAVNESTAYAYLRDLEAFGMVKPLGTIRRKEDKLGRMRRLNGWVKV